jgi:hypothetical protein
MSADNWAICPRCIKRAEADRAAQIAATGASYGKVSEQEYVEAVKAIRDVNPEDFRTFREDYEICGAKDGEVTVSYSGSCSVCGISLSFTDHHAIPGVQA